MPTFNLFETLSLIFLFQALLYLVFLIQSPKSRANLLLITFILILVALILNLYIRFQFPNSIPYLYYEYIALLAPLQFLYVRALTEQKFRFTKIKFYHLTGFIIVAVTRLIFYMVNGELTSVLFDKSLALPLFAFIYTYLFFSIRSIGQYHQTILMTQSSFEKLNLKWLNYEVIVLGFFFGFIGFESISLFFEIGIFYTIAVAFIFISQLVFINILTFKSLQSPSIAKGITQEDLDLVISKQKKYSGSKLSLSESQTHYIQILDLFTEHKPFLEYDLSLNDLAKLTHLSPALVSQIINENSKLNFNDFINHYRVEEAKKMLSDPNNDLLIKEVMYDSGFQSTSTFNESFKKNVGTTPTAFRTKNT